MKPVLLLFLLLGFTAVSQDTTSVEKYTIEQFYGNTRVSGGEFSNDETKLLVSSDESGIFNVYEIDIEDGSKKQITQSKEDSYFAEDYVPGTGEIIYSADKGGNEINHLYLLKKDGEVKDLTPGENEKTSFIRWSEDDKSLLYISNKRDPKFFDVYKMDIGTWQPNMLYQNDEGYQLEGLSHNEQMVALSRPITTSENQLFIYDREKDKMQEISKQKGSYSASGFSKDDQKFYYITDIGKEFSYLVEYDLETGETSPVYETNWDVMYSYLSENDKYRVIAINEDGKNRLIVQNNETGEEIDLPEVPDADIKAVNLSDSENLMRLTIGTSKTPNNLYVYDFRTNEIKKLTNTLNPEIDPEDLVASEVVRYKSFDSLEIPAIYYKPH
ncbi:MAG TPA: S9 family peptidase, partial [Salinimicrobium catena]|nr:S9 family peptidase [Salinimicrobium catena]